jgi:phage tail-like protein
MTQQRFDPLPAFCFQVSLDLPSGTVELYFKSVGGLKVETEVVDYRAGGVNDTTFKLLGATKWSNIVLKKGFVGAGAPKHKELLAWRMSWLTRDAAMKRANGTIIQLDTSLKQTKGTWAFKEGWPVKWELSELDASKNEVAIETLEIAHHGLTFT